MMGNSSQISKFFLGGIYECCLGAFFCDIFSGHRVQFQRIIYQNPVNTGCVVTNSLHLQLFLVRFPKEGSHRNTFVVCDTRYSWYIHKRITNVNPILCPWIFAFALDMGPVVMEICWKWLKRFFSKANGDVYASKKSLIVIFPTPAPKGWSRRWNPINYHTKIHSLAWN